MQPEFFNAFLLFLEREVFASFKLISEYLGQILPWKEMKKTFSIRIQIETFVFA